jgi:dCTP deaminase
MILSDRDIKKEIKNGNIIIKPLLKENIQPASVDIRLGKDFLVYERNSNYVIDPRDIPDNLMSSLTISAKKPFILHPGEFALAVIYEETGVSDSIVGRLEGKSSLGRLGLIIHTTAGYLDPGNSLNMTLELFNAGALPIKLHYKMAIGQIAFEYLSSPCEKPYGHKDLNSKYVGDKTVRSSQMHKNFNKKK